MAKPRKSRRLCGSVAVFGVFNILFSQRHYVTRLQAGSRPCDLRQPSAGLGRSIPSCAAMPERYRQHVFQGRLEEVVGRRSVEGASTWRTSRLRNRHRSVDQCQQRYRRDQLSHDGSPSGGPRTIMVTGSSITRCGKPHVLFRRSSTGRTGDASRLFLLLRASQLGHRRACLSTADAADVHRTAAERGGEGRGCIYFPQ